MVVKMFPSWEFCDGPVGMLCFQYRGHRFDLLLMSCRETKVLHTV